MSKGNLDELFIDKNIVSKIQNKLPKLFQIAEIESSRAGKISMEVGSLREKIIGGLLIHRFGEKNVDTNIPTTEPEVDIRVGSRELSIKTITGNGRIKAVWTVDAESSKNFIKSYKPRCDILLIQTWWGQKRDSIFLITAETQKEIFKLLGCDKYFNMPKAGTNPRGVEFSKEAIEKMLHHKKTLKISINWVKENIKYDVYKRWVDVWDEE
ncbi:MAG: ThaI family type II restriction endonuclease [Candidatus Aenigmarchaeota archaeon]|nr:ThaI family type II restriction endonuclease [Candidatus Aenigmarchaeota archaeon]